MKTLILFFVMLCSLALEAQGPYNLESVPEAVRKNAGVVTHLHEVHLDVESLDKAILTVKKIFTVVNEEASSALLFNEYSTKFITLDDAEIKVFDKAGKQVKRYKKKDMTTVAVGEGLVEDGYVTYLEVDPPSYPVTIEFNYQQKFKGSLFLPAYRFISDKEGVVASSYTAKLPMDLSLRYKAKHTTLEPVISEDGKYKIYQWSVKNMAPIEDEKGSAMNNLPYVEIVANQFSHYGLRGDFSSWKSFGNWINELYKGLDELPTERQQFFQQLVADAPNETEKIRRVYQYLQENFRYVSIQLGIGGLKPFPANFTDQKKYGDCKGLSNYMKAALKAVGIRSHVAIINSAYNMEPADPDFPANNFNHVILCVPRPKDSIWLECTSQTAEFGKLGSATEDRNALLITEEGGSLVPTPKSEAAANTFITRTTVKIEDDFSAVTETEMVTTGTYRQIMSEIVKEKKDDQKEIIVFYLGYKQPEEFELATESRNSSMASLKMTIRKLPEFNSGSKYFIAPRIHKVWASKLPSAEKRKMDFYFQFPFEKKDTTVFRLSAGCSPDVLPEQKELKSPHSYYASRTWYNESEKSIYTTTTLILKKHKIPAADFAEVRNFFEEVIADDSQRIVIKKSATNSPEVKKAF